MLKIVVDTNVVVSAFLKPYSNPALILALIAQQEVNLCLSKNILTEYQGVFSYQKFKDLNQDKVKIFLSQIERDAVWIEPQLTVNILKDDPEDNKFLECALSAKADFLVTGNTKHFPLHSFYHTRIATPAEFLLYYSKGLLS
jgi:putative PIN family toxin of toxin-antitoxin system